MKKTLISLMAMALVFVFAAPVEAAQSKMKYRKKKESNLKTNLGVAMGTAYYSFTPGLTATIHTKVSGGDLPIYVGGDFDLLFAAGYLSGFGLVLAPSVSGELHIPISRARVTPTVGVSMGPALAIAGGAALGFTFLVKPGIVLDIRRNIDLAFQLRTGIMLSSVVVQPMAAVRMDL